MNREYEYEMQHYTFGKLHMYIIGYALECNIVYLCNILQFLIIMYKNH
jgi:hypothetical protein